MPHSGSEGKAMKMNAKALGALAVLRPAEFRKQVVRAYVESGAHLAEAAEKLGVDVSTLARWVTSHGLRERFAEVRKKALSEGWLNDAHRRGGRPRGAKDKRPRKRAPAREVTS